MRLIDRREAYKSFFTGMEAGKALLKQFKELEQDEIKRAQKNMDVNHLAKASGIADCIALIENVLDTEVKE